MTKVYLVHDCDDWKERHWIVATFSTREKAAAYIEEHYPHYVYDEEYDRWEETDDSGYIWIEEMEVH